MEVQSVGAHVVCASLTHALSADPASPRPPLFMLKPRKLTCGAVGAKGSQADELLSRLAGRLLELLQQEAGGSHLLEADPAGEERITLAYLDQESGVEEPAKRSSSTERINRHHCSIFTHQNLGSSQEMDE